MKYIFLYVEAGSFGGRGSAGRAGARGEKIAVERRAGRDVLRGGGDASSLSAGAASGSAGYDQRYADLRAEPQRERDTDHQAERQPFALGYNITKNIEVKAGEPVG